MRRLEQHFAIFCARLVAAWAPTKKYNSLSLGLVMGTAARPPSASYFPPSSCPSAIAFYLHAACRVPLAARLPLATRSPPAKVTSDTAKPRYMILDLIQDPAS